MLKYLFLKRYIGKNFEFKLIDVIIRMIIFEIDYNLIIINLIKSIIK